jgi:hypothetical protein
MIPSEDGEPISLNAAHLPILHRIADLSIGSKTPSTEKTTLHPQVRKKGLGFGGSDGGWS